MAKPVKIFADLSISNGSGEIRVTNDADGSLVIDLPNKESLESIVDLPIPFKPSFNAIGKTNAALAEQRQSVIVKVNNEEWIVLGRDKKATLNYVKLAPFYLKQNLSWKTGLYVLGGGLAAGLAYVLLKRRN
ncbi:MAG: hypothetical protein ACLFUB_13350 [Cyclobacteriaceae bacterium]